MEYITVPTTKGDIKEKVYSVKDFPYRELQMLPTCNGKKRMYYNVSATFDIETTTIEPEMIGDKYVTNPYGFMYHWQFCVNNNVVFGRTWEEFEEFLKRVRRVMSLGKNNLLVVYVHNLAYEFQFMKEFIHIDDMFSKDKRKPMKVISDGIEFRCSYFLSNMSLSKFCENSALCYHAKLSGDDFDYSIVRTPTTPLSEVEKAYCYNDVRGLAECIDTMLEQDTIATIPLTNTGYVRREYREAMKTKKNRIDFEKTKLSAEEYSMLRKAFRGGNTHANRFMANLILDNVYSFDISSSYPSSIAMDYFPIGKFMQTNINSQEKLDYYCENYCCVFEVSFYNINANYDCVIPYIDIAHCEQFSNILNDNGRVLKADYIKITLTNIDIEIIRSMYSYDGFEIHKAIYAEKGKLPKELRQKLMHFYTLKTQLKDIEGKEYEYMKSKNRLNATFGMMVTDVAHTDVDYDPSNMEWNIAVPELEGALEGFYKSRNNFLSYQWGVFVTANARKRLQVMLDKIGTDVVYIDTDSIKFINSDNIKYFEEKNIELQQIAETNDIPAYVDRTDIKDGKEVTNRFYLGTWDNDGNYLRFKTLGAKKYCYEKMKKGKKIFEITVSGMSKKKGAKAVGSIENFQIEKTFADVGRTTSWYNDEKRHTITINGDTFTTASNIGILETTYTLGVTNEYWALIGANENNEII